jgi:hypothetical protein
MYCPLILLLAGIVDAMEIQVTGTQNGTGGAQNFGPGLKVITRNTVTNTIKIDQVKGIEVGQGVFIL